MGGHIGGCGFDAPELGIRWDRSCTWLDIGGYPLPAKPIWAETGTWLAAGIPLENGAALVLVVANEATPSGCGATVQLVAPPTPWVDWHSFAPCAVNARHIVPTRTVSSDWLLTDGWWAALECGEELWRYVALFGTMQLEGVSERRPRIDPGVLSP